MHIVAQNIADVNAKIEILIKHLLSTNVWNSRNEGTTNGSMSIFSMVCLLTAEFSDSALKIGVKSLLCIKVG